MNIHNENFEEKQASKLEYYKNKVEKIQIDYENQVKHTKALSDVIPFGQPILIGHHSEKGHRNHLKKIDNSWKKEFKTLEKKDHYENKVNNLENSHVIRTDDPEAIKKLKEKLVKIENNITQIKEHNKKCKDVIVLSVSKYREGYESIHNTNGNYKQYAKILDGKLVFESKKIPAKIKERIENYMKTKDFKNPELTKDTKRFENYHLSGLNAEKNRIKKRIEKIEILEKMPDVDETINKIRIYTDEGRIKVDFGYKPSEETRTTLKRSGFRWSPYNQVWQSYINQYNLDKAREILKGELN